MAKPGLEVDVCLRESQLKFESADLTFNTIRVSTFSPGFLNRQTILLLDSLGVPQQYFIDKQLECIQACSMSELSRQIEKGKLELLRLGIRSFNEVLKTMAKRQRVNEDPCLRNVMHGMNFANLQRLKKKARIYVHESATLIGVVDEEGILEPDEVFIQIRRDSFRCPMNADDTTINRVKKQQVMNKEAHEQVLLGDLCVTRCPCLHPGDIRLLKGVNKPELAHLYNVVVFSSKGKRPVCNMMAGGDLDGDVYFVSWD